MSNLQIEIDAEDKQFIIDELKGIVKEIERGTDEGTTNGPIVHTDWSLVN